jgi:azurin
VNFDSGERTELTVACLLGGGAAATGTAWFDDLTLIDQGPADERVDDPLGLAVAHALSRTGGAGATEDPDRDLPVLTLGVVPDAMRYDRTELGVRAGQRVRLVLHNADHMPHNALLLRPGTTEAVGALADAMLTDPRALARNYAPDTPDVLAVVPLVNPGETAEVVFAAPATPGVYPIVCTFPGHWRIMQTTLVVR